MIHSILQTLRSLKAVEYSEIVLMGTLANTHLLHLVNIIPAILVERKRLFFNQQLTYYSPPQFSK